MKRKILKELLLYQYRYIVGYVLFGLLLVALLSVHLTSLPPGLTRAEMDTAALGATSSIGNILFTSAVDAPYLLLQKLSLFFFDITVLGIKIPSVVLGIITGIALALMLRRWFRVNVAVLAGILAATSSPFLVMGRTGTAAIMMTFWLSIILLAATKMLHNERRTFFWKLLCFVAAALSLYTPLMIYPLIALGIAGLLHPHVRFILRRTPIIKFLIAISAALLAITPLIWSIIQTPSTLKIFLGLPDALPGWSQIIDNASLVFSAFFAFDSIQANELLLPLFGTATVALIFLGLLKLLVDRFSARSYMLVIWLLLLIPLVLIEPSNILIYFMPSVLLLSIGIETLIREWYQLFPRNPYARVAALIPLTILLVSISASNVSRYFYGYTYAAEPGVFSQELSLIRDTLSKSALQNKPVTLVVPSDQIAFFDLMRRDYDSLSVSASPSQTPAVIVTESAYQNLSNTQQTALGVPYHISTSSTTDNSLILRVYVSE